MKVFKVTFGFDEVGKPGIKRDSMFIEATTFYAAIPIAQKYLERWRPHSWIEGVELLGELVREDH